MWVCNSCVPFHAAAAVNNWLATCQPHCYMYVGERLCLYTCKFKRHFYANRPTKRLKCFLVGFDFAWQKASVSVQILVSSQKVSFVTEVDFQDNLRNYSAKALISLPDAHPWQMVGMGGWLGGWVGVGVSKGWWGVNVLCTCVQSMLGGPYGEKKPPDGDCKHQDMHWPADHCNVLSHVKSAQSMHWLGRFNMR